MNEQEASIELTRLINGFQVSQIIHVAASLRIADHLKGGSRSATEIAAATGAHVQSMYRLLHALASTGVVAEEENEFFALTPIGECLRSDSRYSRAAWARNIGRPYAWQAWGDLLQSVTSGVDAFRRQYGVSVWDWRAKLPEEAEFFDAAMTELSRGVADAIADVVDFSSFECIVDVGGGRGEFLADLLSNTPAVRGILFDLPHVVLGSPDLLAARGVSDRCG